MGCLFCFPAKDLAFLVNKDFNALFPPLLPLPASAKHVTFQAEVLACDWVKSSPSVGVPIARHRLLVSMETHQQSWRWRGYAGFVRRVGDIIRV